MIFKLEPEGYFRRIPLEPHQLTEPVTALCDAIVLCHLGVPQINARDWSLTVDGIVAQDKRFDLDLLRRYAHTEIESIHECAGNPLQPDQPTRRVCNIVWGGIRLADLLGDCSVDPEARYLWSHGADYGSFHGVNIPAYVKDLPLSRVGHDVLIATSMNGEPLPREHGFPARLVVPGFYGTNSVKWLTRLTLATERSSGPFTTIWYNDPVHGENGEVTGSKPVWALAPHSAIVSPASGQEFNLGDEINVWGWAWSDAGIERLAITPDGGASWIEAKVEPQRGRAWQRFSADFAPPAPGRYTLSSRAAERDGTCQPREGKRNAWHQVVIDVRDR